MDKFKSFESQIIKLDTNKDTNQQLIKLFSDVGTKIRKEDDYYDYINYRWISDKEEYIKKEDKFYVQLDSFRLTQEKVYYELMEYVQEYIKKNNNKKAKCISNVYQSLLNLNENVAQKNVYKCVEKIDYYINRGNLIEFLAYINNNEIVSWACPIVWELNPDDKNSSTFTNFIHGPQLSVYDYNLYLESNKDSEEIKKYKKKYKTLYFEYIGKIFNSCLGIKNKEVAKEIWAIEKELLNAMDCQVIKNESLEEYNVVKSEESKEKYGFDWPNFAKHLGYKNVPKFFITPSLSSLKCTMDLLIKNDNWKKWRYYWIYIYLRQIIRFHNSWRNIYYEFNGLFVRGQPKIFPNYLYPIFGLSLCFNTFLTNIYIEKNQKKEILDYVENLGNGLKEVFIKIIEKNTWLSPKTKKYALLKLKHLKLVIGSPKLLMPDPLLNYSSDDPWDNLYKITTWRTFKQISLAGKEVVDIPMVDWNEFKLIGTQSYIVNAFYTPTQNSIYIPLAYLQKPFIDLEERGIEYNLAYIGFTLSHEMSHSLDDLGSQYDYNGNLKNWWTVNDRIKFDKKVDDVIKQYETFASYDGIKMDASLSTGENLADISGLGICQKYLQEFQEKNNDIVQIRHLSYEAFFTYFAIQARQKIYNKAIQAQLKINPHPLDKYRTNCPLARLAIFQSIYNIKKTDKMYWNNLDTIW